MHQLHLVLRVVCQQTLMTKARLQTPMGQLTKARRHAMKLMDSRPLAATLRCHAPWACSCPRAPVAWAALTILLAGTSRREGGTG